MVGYAVNDSLPFAMMGLLLMLRYSTAFMVLFDNGSGDDDRNTFDTFPHALETLFHTSLGNFENDVSSVSRHVPWQISVTISWCRCSVLPMTFSQSGGLCCLIPSSMLGRLC